MHQPELILAVDAPSTADLLPLVKQLPSVVTYCKIGLELFTAEGPAALRPFQQMGRRVFLDLKLHDIPHTVARAVDAAARHHIDLLTIHAAGGRAMLQAAATAARAHGDRRPRLVAVTTLTSLDQSDLADLGIERDVPAQAEALARLAIEAGMDGLVASVHEVRRLRERFGAAPILVTPGIRMPSDATGDQKRVATPGDAVRAGADYLVVGRAITAAVDPAAAAARIFAEMQAAKPPVPRSG